MDKREDIFELLLPTVKLESLISENNFQTCEDSHIFQFESSFSSLSSSYLSQSKPHQLLLTAPIFRLCSRILSNFLNLLHGSPKRNQSLIKILSLSLHLLSKLEMDEKNQQEFYSLFALWGHRLIELHENKKISEGEIEHLLRESVSSLSEILIKGKVENKVENSQKNDEIEKKSIFSSLLLFILSISSDFFSLHNSKILVQNSISMLNELLRLFPDDSLWFDHLPGLISTIYKIALSDKKASRKGNFDAFSLLLRICMLTIPDDHPRHREVLDFLGRDFQREGQDENPNSKIQFSIFLNKNFDSIKEDKPAHLEEYSLWRIDFLQKITIVITRMAENCFPTCNIENKKKILNLFFDFLSKSMKFLGVNIFTELLSHSFLLLMSYERDFTRYMEDYCISFIKDLRKENSKYYYDLISSLTSHFIVNIKRLTNTMSSTLQSSNVLVNSLLKCYGYFLLLKNESLSSLLELNYENFFNFFVQLFKIDVNSMRKSLLLESKSYNFPINSFSLFKLIHNSTKKITLPSFQLSYYQFPFLFLPNQRGISSHGQDFSSNSLLLAELLVIMFGNELKNSSKFLSELKAKNKKMMKILYYCLFSKVYDDDDEDDDIRQKMIDEYETKKSPVNMMSIISSEAISILNIIKLVELRKIQFCHLDYTPVKDAKTESISRRNICSFSKCNKENSNLRCSRCRLVFYCCQEHQVIDWKTHKHVCKPQLETKKEKINMDEEIERNHLVKLFENNDSVFSPSGILHSNSKILFCLTENKKSEFVLKTDLLKTLFETTDDKNDKNKDNIEKENQLFSEDKIIFKKVEVKNLIEIFNFFTVQFEFYLSLLYSSQLLDRFSLRKEKFRLLLPYYSFYISFMCQVFGDLCILLPQKYLVLLCKESIYTLLEMATLEEDDVVKVAAIATLSKLGHLLGSNSVSSFLMNHFDYLIDKICNILRSSIEKIKEQNLIDRSEKNGINRSDFFNISATLKSLCITNPYWEKFFIHYDRSYKCHKVISFLFKECSINISEMKESYDKFMVDEEVQKISVKNSCAALTPIIYLRDMIQDSLAHMDISQLYTNQIQEDVVSRTILSICEVLKALVVAFEVPYSSLLSNYTQFHWKYLPKSCFVYKEIEKSLEVNENNNNSINNIDSNDIKEYFKSINSFFNNVSLIHQVSTDISNSDDIHEIHRDEKNETEGEKDEEVGPSDLPSSLSLLFSIAQRSLYILSLPILSTQVSSLYTIQSVLLRVSSEKQFFPQLLYKVWTSLSKRIIDLTNKVVQHNILSSHILFKPQSNLRRRVIATEKLEFSSNFGDQNFLKLSNSLDNTSQNFIGSMLKSKKNSSSRSIKETKIDPNNLSADYNLFSYVLDTVSLMILLDSSFLSHKIDEELMPCAMKILAINHVLSLNSEVTSELNSFFSNKKWKICFLQLLLVIYNLSNIYFIQQKYVQGVLWYILSFTRPNEDRDVIILAHSLILQLRLYDPSFSLLLSEYCSESIRFSSTLKMISESPSLKLSFESASPPIMNWNISSKTREILQGKTDQKFHEIPPSYSELLSNWSKV